MDCPTCHFENPSAAKHCQECGSSLTGGATGSSAKLGQTAAESALVQRLNQAFSGKYRIERKLGSGGMGEIFEARHIALGSSVAIKVLSSPLNRNEELIRRFFREARSAAALKHPNIINIQDVGEVDGLHYLVMDYVDGQDLKSFIRANPHVDPRQAIDIISQIGRALAYAHSRGVVHRDIKPANIMIDRHGTALVMDFGIAKVRDSTTQLTQEGTLIGTPHYMSPEQCRGEEVTAQSDIYSLGVVVYQLLAGRVPFEGGDSLSIIYQHINVDPFPLGELRGHLPEGLIRVVHRMLEKDLAKRYTDADVLVADLEQLKDEIQVERGRTATRLAPPIATSASELDLTTPMPRPMKPSPAPASPPTATPKWRTYLLLGVAAVVLAGGTLAFWRARRPATGIVEPARATGPPAASNSTTVPVEVNPRPGGAELRVGQPAPKTAGESRRKAQPAGAAASTPRPTEARRVVPITLSARHRHTIGSCEGTLTIAPDAVSYQAVKEGKDSFKRGYDRILISGSGNRLTLKFPDRKYDFDLASAQVQEEALQKLKQFGTNR